MRTFHLILLSSTHSSTRDRGIMNLRTTHNRLLNLKTWWEPVQTKGKTQSKLDRAAQDIIT